MKMRNHWQHLWPEKKSQRLQRIFVALLPFSCLVTMIANQSIAQHLSIANIYVFLTPCIMLPIWLPLVIAQYRSIDQEWKEEKREIQQRHEAEDAALFGVKIDTQPE